MQGFKSISVKVKDKSRATHVLFMKQHAVREKVSEKPTDRTLFLVGVPPYCTEEMISGLFRHCGKVSAVYFHKTPNSQLPPVEQSKYFPCHPVVKGYKVAYVVFESEKGLNKALKIKADDTLVLVKKGNELETGVKKWCKEYNSRIPDVNELNVEIETYMKSFDKEVEEESKKEKKLTEADEDGWITVTKKGRRPGFARKESVQKQLLKRDEKRKKKTELVNFYRFQIRESKLKNIIALRKKFDEDKKKIEALKQTRKFRPF